jgi:hypothetical protein
MFNTPPQAATSTCSRKSPQSSKPGAFSALIITDGTTTVGTIVARGLSLKRLSTNSNRAHPPSMFDPISSDGNTKDE